MWLSKVITSLGCIWYCAAYLEKIGVKQFKRHEYISILQVVVDQTTRIEFSWWPVWWSQKLVELKERSHGERFALLRAQHYMHASVL